MLLFLFVCLLFLCIIGKQSEPSVERWMENFLSPCMAVCGVYVCVLYVHNIGMHGKFYGLDLRSKMSVLENPPWIC